MYKVKEFDATIERRIVIGMIVSTDFLAEAIGVFQEEFFRIPSLRTATRWCLEYYSEFGEAPNAHFRDIYESRVRSGELLEDMTDEIEIIFTHLSQEYLSNPQLNVRYLLRKLEDLMKSRALMALGEDLISLVGDNSLEEAESALHSFRPVSRAAISWSNPFSLQDSQVEALSKEANVLFRFPGAVGELIGPIERDSFIGLQAPEKRGKCLPASQRIQMANGEYLPLGAVIQNDRRDIISYDETSGKFVNTFIQEYWDNGIKDVYEVVTRTGRKVQVTLNHPFLTVTGWKDLQDIKVGDFISTPKRVNTFGKALVKEEVIRLLAYFITEGCLTAEFPSFTTADPDIKNDFIRCVEVLGCRVVWTGIDGHVYNSFENYGKHGKNNVRKILIAQNMMGKLSYEKHIPPIIYQLPKEKLSLFLSLLFTCDGWICDGGEGIGFCVANKYLAEQVQYFLTRFGIISRLQYKKNDKAGAWSVDIRDYENMVVFMQEIGFQFGKQQKAIRVLQEKQKSFRSFVDKVPYQIAHKFYLALRKECKEKKVGLYSYFGKNKTTSLRYQINRKLPLMRQSFQSARGSEAYHKYLETDIYWDQISSINYVGKMPTYDITVAKHHNFVAENMLVHNTFWLWEFAIRAVMNRCNVAFFSLGDMSDVQNWRRVFGWVLRSSRRSAGKEVLVPVLDCLSGQKGECGDCDQEPIFTKEGKMLSFDEAPDHEPCIRCMYNNPSNFVGSFWYEKQVIPPFLPGLAQERMRTLSKRFGGKTIRLQCYPAGQANVQTIRNNLDIWEKRDGWTADIVVADYADILAPENNKERETRHQINATWMALRGLSTERSIAVITATQAAKTSYGKSQQETTDVSEDKRKLGHVTSMIGLNQTPEEKRAKIMRVSQLLNREDDFDSYRNATVLQCLQMSRPLLHSYWINSKNVR